MGKLTEAVRSGKAQHPTAFNFDISKWNSIIRKHGIDNEDKKQFLSPNLQLANIK